MTAWGYKMKNEELRVKSDGMQCLRIAFRDKEALRSSANQNYSLTSQGGA
jgi:hypothetical protein